MKGDNNKYKGTDIEVMLGKFHITHPEGFNCDSAKPINRMCVNPSCKEVSLICSDFSCNCCKNEVHK